MLPHSPQAQSESCSQQLGSSAYYSGLNCPHDHRAVTILGTLAFAVRVSTQDSQESSGSPSSSSLYSWLTPCVLTAPGVGHPPGLCPHNQPAAQPEPFSTASLTSLRLLSPFVSLNCPAQQISQVLPRTASETHTPLKIVTPRVHTGASPLLLAS